MKKVIGGIEAPMPGGLVHWQPLYQREPDPEPVEEGLDVERAAQKKGIFERVDRKPPKPKP